MRFVSTAAWVCVAFGLGACSDDKPAPIAEDLSWKLSAVGSGSAPAELHNSAAITEDLKVTCGRSASGYSFSIEDPGKATSTTVNGMLSPTRTQSVITVTNFSATGGACLVTVQEGPLNASLLKYTGYCNDGCTVTQDQASGGFDFVGTLVCSGLKKDGAASLFSLSADGAGAAPLLIKLSNCK